MSDIADVGADHPLYALLKSLSPDKIEDISFASARKLVKSLHDHHVTDRTGRTLSQLKDLLLEVSEVHYDPLFSPVAEDIDDADIDDPDFGSPPPSPNRPRRGRCFPFPS